MTDDFLCKSSQYSPPTAKKATRQEQQQQKHTRICFKFGKEPDARLMLCQKTQATLKTTICFHFISNSFFPGFGYLSTDYFPIPADNSCDWQVARGNLTIHEAKAKELDPAQARQRNSCSLHYLRDKENSVLWHSNSTAMVSHLGYKNRDSDAVYHMIIITTLFRWLCWMAVGA